MVPMPLGPVLWRAIPTYGTHSAIPAFKRHKIYQRKLIGGTIAFLIRSVHLPSIPVHLMKNVITCSIMLAGYIAAAVLFLCGALLYLPVGMVAACVEVARDRKARASALQVQPLQPELGKE
jgi:hypothetical protein